MMESPHQAKVRLPSGDIVRMSCVGLQMVGEDDVLGVSDILHLNNFSEKSLVHTLRLRYQRVPCCALPSLLRLLCEEQRNALSKQDNSHAQKNGFF